MSTPKQVGTTVYQIPDNLEEPGWGEDLSAYLKAVADALGSVQNAEDILQSSAAIANNQATPANINLLAFSTTRILSFTVEYFIKRVYDGGSVASESGVMIGHYDGSVFTFSREAVGDAGVDITITGTGQFQYTSSNLTSQTEGLIEFKATTLID